MFRHLIEKAKIWENKKLKLLGEEIEPYALMNMLLPQLEKLERNFPFYRIITYHVYKLEKSSDDSIHRITVWLFPVNLVVHSRGANNKISHSHERLLVSTTKLAIYMSDCYEFSLIFFKTTLVLLKFAE